MQRKSVTLTITDSTLAQPLGDKVITSYYKGELFWQRERERCEREEKGKGEAERGRESERDKERDVYCRAGVQRTSETWPIDGSTLAQPLGDKVPTRPTRSMREMVR